MTINSTIFDAQELENLFNGEPVRASDWQRIAGNQNVLYSLATGQTLPGAADGVDGHNHAQHGGRAIPFHQAGVLGNLLPITYGANSPVGIALARSIHAQRFTVEKAGTLQQGVNQHHVALLATMPGTSGPIQAHHQWVLPGTTGNPHRYLRGPLLEDTLDWMVLYDPLTASVTPGPSCFLESLDSSDTFALELPSWCTRLVVMFPALLSAEFLLEPDDVFPRYNWWDEPLRAGSCWLERVTSGEPQCGPAQSLFLQSPFDEPPMLALEITPDGTGRQVFRLRFEADSDGIATGMIRLFAPTFGKENFFLHHQRIRGVRRPAQAIYAMLRD